jgi:hypothetical protein
VLVPQQFAKPIQGHALGREQLSHHHRTTCHPSPIEVVPSRGGISETQRVAASLQGAGGADLARVEGAQANIRLA